MSRRRAAGVQERFNVWPGFTDVMVGLLLVFVFVVTLFTMAETVLSRSISKKDVELTRLHQEISAKSEALDRLTQEISRLEKLFQSEVQKTTDMQEQLASRSKELDLALSEIKEYAGLLDDRDLRLSEQSRRIDEALTAMKDKTDLLKDREQSIWELGLKLSGAERDLGQALGRIDDKDKALLELQARVHDLNTRIGSLNERIAAYTSEIARLNQLVSDSKTSEVQERTKASALQKEIASLQARLQEISAKLAGSEAEAEKKFRLSQLVDLLGQKDRQLEQLRKLAKYRSEFLAKLEQVFSGVPDIKIQGDRFIFQSEILFASGRSDINETGKRELDKFVKIYKEMVPKIPGDVDLVILVQGHTDIDPVRSSKYRSNWELSADRAMQVVRYLIESGLPPTRLGAAALGEFHPVEKGDTPEAKRFNRRIEIKITNL
jgi:chemotaxis protein MotB